MRKTPVRLAALLVLAAGCREGSTEPKIVPVPVLTSVSPTEILIGSGDVELTFTGAGFQPESQTRFNAKGLATTFVSETELRGIVPADQLDTGGTYPVSVFTLEAGTGGASSGTREITVYYAAPTLASLSYSSATVNQSNPPLVQVDGTGFFFGSTVLWDGEPLTTLYQSPTRIMFTPRLSTAGTFQIFVRNPTPGGGDSAPTTFTVQPAS